MKFTLNTLMVVVLAVSLNSCRSRDHRMSKLKDELSESIVNPGRLGGAMVFGEVNLTGNRNVGGGLPRLVGGRSHTKTDLYLSREQFVLSYDGDARIPVWAAWQVVKSDLGDVLRQPAFRSDHILNAYLEEKERADGLSPDDYRNTCFDRGHQSPAADRSNSVEDNEATFLMSNMAPQTGFLNRGMWKNLEDFSRELVETHKYKLQIFAGGILEDGREGIGPNKDIQVPTSFYKVIAIYEDRDDKAPISYIAVIMPNVTAGGLDPLANNDKLCKEQNGSFGFSIRSDWQFYVKNLKQIEDEAGVQFPMLQGIKPFKVD